MSASKNKLADSKPNIPRKTFKDFVLEHKFKIIAALFFVFILVRYNQIFNESEKNGNYSSQNTVYLYFLGFSIGCLLISFLKGKWGKIAIINWVVIFIILGGFEFYLKKTNYDNILNYSEVNGSSFTTDYWSYRHTLKEREKGRLLYMHSLPNIVHRDQKPEFDFTYQLDSYGNNNCKTCNRTDALVSIVTLGDSYTFGIGARANKSWPNQLDSLFEENHLKVGICNISTSGSDPLYMFNIYGEWRAQGLPGDILLVTLNSSDAKDVVVRGGINRYQQGMTYDKGNEKWLPYYASSLIYRMYMQKVKDIEPYLLVKRDEVDPLYMSAFDNLFMTMIQFDQLAKQHNKQVVFVFNPGYHEVLENRLLLNDIVNEARNFKFHVIDLLPAFVREYKRTNNVFDFFWEKDFHNNEAGYRIWAEEVYKYLMENHLFETS